MGPHAEAYVRAKGGVCMCTGGFESNRAMISSFAQLPYLYPRAGAYNEGDGVSMCQAVSASLYWCDTRSERGGWAERPHPSKSYLVVAP